MGLQSLVECGQRLSRHDIRRQAIPRTCGNNLPGCCRMYGNNREGTVGGRWQPDGRHYQTTSVCRMKRSLARLVSDATEWSKVLWHESMQDFVRQYGDLELNSFWDPQPMQTDQRITELLPYRHEAYKILVIYSYSHEFYQLQNIATLTVIMTTYTSFNRHKNVLTCSCSRVYTAHRKHC